MRQKRSVDEKLRGGPCEIRRARFYRRPALLHLLSPLILPVHITKFINEKTALPGSLLAAAVLSFINIDRGAVWHDEGFTAKMIKFSFPEIVHRTSLDVHPPLYYWAVKAWTGVLGTSEAGMRSFSTLMFLGFVAIVFLTAKKLFDARSATLTAFFVALSPFMVRYAVEARMWMMVAFELILATWFLLRWIESGKNRELVFYGFVLAASLYTQYFAVLIVPVHWIYVLLKKKIVQNEWWIANIGAAFVFAPWLPTLYRQFTKVNANYWIRPEWMTIRTVPSNLYEFITWARLDWLPGLAHEIILALILAAAVFGFIKMINRRSEVIFVLCYFLLPMHLVFVFSKLRTPLYQERYFTFAAAGLFIFLASVISSLKNKIAYFMLSGILTTALGVGLVVAMSDPAQQMREAAAAVNTGYLAGDEVVCGEIFVYFDFSYYNRTGRECRVLGIDFGGFGEASLLYDRKDLLLPALGDLRSAHIWLVGKPDGRYYAQVPEGYEKVFDRSWNGARIVEYKKS